MHETTTQPLAVVTGASSGIGAACAHRLAERGYRTVLIARRREHLEALAAEIGGVAVPMDLMQVDAIGPAMQQMVATHGVPRVLINNAGEGQYRPFLETTMADERRLFDLLYHAPSAMIRALLPSMLEAQRGMVINICSVATRIGPWGHSSYAAAKSALVALTQTLAAEHRDSNVRFSYVNPGIVQTPFFESAETRPVYEAQRHHAISADRVAQGVVGLLDRPRLVVTIPASFRFLDFAYAISPGLAHRLVATKSTPREV